MDIIEYSLGDDAVLTVEAEPGDGWKPGSSQTERIVGELDGALSPIKAAATSIVSTFQAIGPSEIEVQLGVKLTGEAGAILAKTSAEAHLTLTLKWASRTEATTG